MKRILSRYAPASRLIENDFERLLTPSSMLHIGKASRRPDADDEHMTAKPKIESFVTIPSWENRIPHSEIDTVPEITTPCFEMVLPPLPSSIVPGVGTSIGYRDPSCPDTTRLFTE